MPLSKTKQAEYMREYRKHVRYNVIPNESMQPEPEIPLYNPSKHGAGDTVIINGKVTVIPELDADGNPIRWSSF